MEHDFQSDIDAVNRIDLVPLLLDVVARRTGMKFIAVARVTDGRWVTCQSFDRLNFGLKPGDELDVTTTICNDVRQVTKAVIFDDAELEEAFCQHVAVRTYGFRSYFSFPIMLSDGTFFGTLCGIDPSPRAIANEENIGMLTLFSDLIARHLELVEQVAAKQELIRLLREKTEAREQIIAVLAHDIRNPLAAVGAGLKLLQKQTLPAKAEATLALMNGSVRRATLLVENAMDFARSRLGDPIAAHTTRGVRLQAFLNEVAGEMSAATGGRFVVEAPDVDFDCDPGKLAQLLSNLMRNAVTHGDPAEPIALHASVSEAEIVFRITNRGPAIPEGLIDTLFQPYVRSNPTHSGGLGLGLHIASEIAKAHGGAISVASDAARTSFCVTIPRRQP